jgi:hypothetical protein
MESLFSKPGKNPVYEEIRQAPEHRRTRRLIETWWASCWEYLDNNFLTGCRNSDFIACFWEMHLAATLVGHGWPLAKRRERSRSIKTQDRGPDFKLLTEAPVWIEAVTPGPGQGSDAVPPLSPGCIREVLDDEVKLRLLQAIRDKAKDRRRFIETGIVGARDPYLIAINTSKIPNEPDFEPSRLNRAVFGWGMPVEEYDWERETAVDEKMDDQDRILRKPSGNPVSTRIFLDREDPSDPNYLGYEGVSAILSSWLGPAHIESLLSSRWPFLADAFEVVHNPLSSNALPSGLLKVGREYRRDDNDVLQLTSWFERPKSERGLILSPVQAR